MSIPECLKKCWLKISTSNLSSLIKSFALLWNSYHFLVSISTYTNTVICYSVFGSDKGFFCILKCFICFFLLVLIFLTYFYIEFFHQRIAFAFLSYTSHNFPRRTILGIFFVLKLFPLIFCLVLYSWMEHDFF